jgi:hypothetical protein
MQWQHRNVALGLLRQDCTPNKQSKLAIICRSKHHTSRYVCNLQVAWDLTSACRCGSTPGTLVFWTVRITCIPAGATTFAACPGMDMSLLALRTVVTDPIAPGMEVIDTPVAR